MAMTPARADSASGSTRCWERAQPRHHGGLGLAARTPRQPGAARLAFLQTGMPSCRQSARGRRTAGNTAEISKSGSASQGDNRPTSSNAQWTSATGGYVPGGSRFGLSADRAEDRAHIAGFGAKRPPPTSTKLTFGRSNAWKRSTRYTTKYPWSIRKLPVAVERQRQRQAELQRLPPGIRQREPDENQPPRRARQPPPTPRSHQAQDGGPALERETSARELETLGELRNRSPGLAAIRHGLRPAAKAACNIDNTDLSNTTTHDVSPRDVQRSAPPASAAARHRCFATASTR